jgi:hypothetical protein
MESYEGTVSKTNNHYSRIVQSDPCRHAFQAKLLQDSRWIANDSIQTPLSLIFDLHIDCDLTAQVT